MADAADLKSALRKEVWVRVPPSAYTKPSAVCLIFRPYTIGAGIKKPRKLKTKILLTME
jgi:hypothetical protein